jgi:ankyrin repeat protein
MSLITEIHNHLDLVSYIKPGYGTIFPISKIKWVAQAAISLYVTLWVLQKTCPDWKKYVLPQCFNYLDIKVIGFISNFVPTVPNSILQKRLPDPLTILNATHLEWEPFLKALLLVPPLHFGPFFQQALEKKSIDFIKKTFDLCTDEQSKKIIPILFTELEKGNYYTESQPLRICIYPLFQKGLKLKVIDLNTPLDSQGTRALHQNISSDTFTTTLLELGADPNLKGPRSATSFHLAAEQSNLTVIKLFVQQGAELNAVDDKGCTPLGRCLKKRRLEVALFLLEQKALRKETFPYCSMEEFETVISLLLKQPSDEIIKTHNRMFATETNLQTTIPVYLKVLQKSNDYLHKPGIQKWIEEIVLTGWKLGVAKINTPLESQGTCLLHLKISSDTFTTKLLKLGADPNLKGPGGATPFHLAAEQSNLAVIKLFVEQGAELNAVDDQGCTPLIRSLKKGRLEIALFLLRKKNLQKEPFPHCSQEEFEALIPVLLQNLPALYRSEYKNLAKQWICQAIQKQMIDLKTHGGPLFHWGFEDIDFMELLLKKGVSPDVVNAEGETVLHGAVENRRSDLILKLYEYKVSIPQDPELALEASELFYNFESLKFLKCLLAFWKQISFNDLSYQAQNEHMPKLYSLLFSPTGLGLLKSEKTANTPFTRDGLTPLHLAVIGGNMAAVDIVLNNLGGNPLITFSQFRLTALHLAVMWDRPEVTSYLVQKYPPLLWLKDSSGETALEYALRFHFELVPIFVEYGKPEDLIPFIQNEKIRLAEPIPSADLPIEIARIALYSYLRKTYAILLKKHRAFQESFSRVANALNLFKASKAIRDDFLPELDQHRPYLPYLQNIPYLELFGSQIKTLQSTLESDDLYGCLFCLAEQALAEQNKEKISSIKEALLVLHALYNNFARTSIPPIESPFLLMSQKLAHELQTLTSKNASQTQDFMKDFDDNDSATLIATFFATNPSYTNKHITGYCQKAYEMGLAEGRDLRAVGIDDTIAALCDLIDIQQTLEVTILKKQALLQNLQKQGFLKDLSCPEKLELHSEWKKWESSFNIALLLFILSQKNKEGINLLTSLVSS